MTPADDPLPEFPPESTWLDASPPDIAPDFVGRTLARLRDVSLVAPEARAAHDERMLARLDLPREVLDADVPPPASPGFVDGVLAGLRRQREEELTGALHAYRVPEPSPEFVARTLAALRVQHRRPVLRFVRSRTALVAAVLLAALSLVLRGLADERPSESHIAATVAVGIPSGGPSLLAALVQAAERDADDLPLLAADASPWAVAPGGGR